MDCFVSFISYLQLNEFYLRLSINEKLLIHRFGSYLADEEQLWPNFSKASFLWVTAANAIPTGENEFAKKLLHEALTVAKYPKDISYIHSNLAQIYQDEDNLDASNFHCHQALSTGYYNKWAVDTLMTNLIKASKFSEAREVCKTLIANQIYQKERIKYEKILAYVEVQLKMTVQ